MKLKCEEPWVVSASTFAKNTCNPIRNVVENLVLNPNPDKPMIALSIGDPTVFGNLAPSPESIDAIVQSIQSGKYHGYAPSTGYVEARAAVAEYVSCPGAQVTANDVVLTSGCSCALDLAITVLACPGDNILVPRPGFPLYKTLAEGLGIETRQYDLIPELNWEPDLEHLQSLIDEKTRTIIVNNPSNPCGSVYTQEQLKKILRIAEEYKLPIIADEIYDDFVFSESTPFYRMASLTSSVPILSCGGLTKRFLCPGWRMGWIIVYDKNGIFDHEIRLGLHRLSQRIIGSNTIVQGALPAILRNTPQSFFDETISIVKRNADLAFKILSEVPGLKPIPPQGAMYMMIAIDLDRFPAFQDDLEFVEAMVSEQSVFCLPGKCFDYPRFCRIVLTVPQAQTQEACERIEQFCRRHYVDSLKYHTIIPSIPENIKPSLTQYLQERNKHYNGHLPETSDHKN
ncbi:unnamed protein product [Cyprideis torosa]|uniref:Tyrosine aminotransferase n=1 Tax=Cyprideis torosa TaxID=163714 RepID=A0A7R8W3W5_9CRUS|nr:unnamed protein product [Cyprideis torosa]CAG0879322.1 unnamed protein product [Cyprideis torosa]